MTDLVIGRCDLRIRRPAGTAPPWLDSDDHSALARRVQAIVLPMLEELLAPRLSARPRVQRPRLQLDLKLTALDLAGVAPLARPALRARLAASVETALAEAEASAHLSSKLLPDRELPDAPPQPVPTPGPPPDNTAAAIGTLLERLFRDDRTLATAWLLPAPGLTRLLAGALQAVAPGSASTQPAAAGPAADAVGATPPDLDVLDQATLIAALRDLAQVSGAPCSDASVGATGTSQAVAAARRLLARAAAASGEHRAHTLAPGATRIGRNDQAPAPAAARREQPSGTAPADRHAAGDRPAVTAGAGIAPGRYKLDHALPFLALAVLARHGVAQTLALDAPDPGVLATLAAAIALKSLPAETARGPGARTQGARWAAALAANLDRLPDGAAFAAAAAHPGAGGEFARAAVAAALLGSLHPQGALPLVAHGGRLVLFDPGGLYPVAAGPPEALTALLAATGRTLFLSAPDPAVWDTLEAAGLPVMAEGPPVGGERAVPIVGPRGWRGRATRVVRRSHGLGAQLATDAATANRAANVWRTLGPEAPLVARPADSATTRRLDELATLLAGFALAEMGWVLWRRDPASWTEPDPLLVRERFADLSGWVELGHRRITVALPLGRRFSDLRDTGLLDTVAGLPGWPHHAIAFRGG